MGYNFIVHKVRSIFGSFSPIAITAMLSIVALVGVGAWKIQLAFQPAAVVAAAETEPVPTDEEITAEWQQEMLLLGIETEIDPSAPSTVDPLALIAPAVAGQLLGSYAALAESGDYTQEDLAAAADRIAPYVKAAVTYKTYEISEFATDADISEERVRMYREELLKSLAPLNDISAEYETYGRYVETSDPQYLKQLQSAASIYRTAADDAARIVVPRDAVNYHKTVLNSLQYFAAAIEGLATHADDPFASVALLRTFGEAEAKIAASYSDMKAYYDKKSL